MTSRADKGLFDEPAPPVPAKKAYMPFPPSLAPHANEVEHPAPPVSQTPRKPDGVAVTAHVSGQFLVERVRADGRGYAAIFYSRSELEQLVVAANEALGR